MSHILNLTSAHPFLTLKYSLSYNETNIYYSSVFLGPRSRPSESRKQSNNIITRTLHLLLEIFIKLNMLRARTAMTKTFNLLSINNMLSPVLR